MLRLPIHEDARGWFKEAWQRRTMTALGLPDFGPVQHNISYNTARGVTRGIHAEPWDKLVGAVTGRVLGAWVDLREGATFGTTVTVEVDRAVAVFVPRGVGNAFQTLEDGTAYSYLVSEHWRPDAAYLGVDLADPDLGIDWPIPPAQAVISDKDRTQPRLAEVTPISRRTPLVLGAAGRLGRALVAALPGATALTRADLDITDEAALAAYDWSQHDVVVNAAAMTAVDHAETDDGRREAWAANAHAPATLARLALEHRLTLVHYSTDYVYDGRLEEHTEDEGVAPLGVYGQSKAAGDLAVSVAPRHYVLRTSWLVDDGPATGPDGYGEDEGGRSGFVATMTDLARRGASPTVVDDQVGRLTTTTELARATADLLAAEAPFGTYHVTGEEPPRSWAQIARDVFAAEGRDPADVAPVSSAAWAASRPGPVAPRPRHSTLDLARFRRATGSGERRDETGPGPEPLTD